jgi:hypothetical protein
MITRRTFLFGGVVGTGAVLVSATRPSTGYRETVSLNAEVPHLIFFPECRPDSLERPGYCESRPVQITTIGLQTKRIPSSTEPQVIVSFSNGKSLAFRRSDSFDSLRNTNNGRIRRDAVMLKSIVSFSLDRVATRYSRARGSCQRMRADFLRLQEQDVLESVTIGALYQLVSGIVLRKNVCNVVWNNVESRFIIN